MIVAGVPLTTPNTNTTNITMKHLNQQTLLRNSRRGKTSVLKVIGFAMLGVAVVGVLGRMLK